MLLVMKKVTVSHFGCTEVLKLMDMTTHHLELLRILSKWSRILTIYPLSGLVTAILEVPQSLFPFHCACISTGVSSHPSCPLPVIPKLIFYLGIAVAKQMLATYPDQLFLVACQKNRPTPLFAPMHTEVKTKGQVATRTNPENTITSVTYYDSGKCNFFSNFCGTSPMIPNCRPLIIEEYNKWMGGVDCFDSGFNRYLFPHKKTVWTQCFLLNLLKMCVVNAWTVFRYSNPNNHKFSQKKFILAWLKSMYPNNKIPIQPPELVKAMVTEGNRHWTTPLENKKEKRCIYCRRNGKDSKTRFGCPTCNVPLHQYPCHEKYHEGL